MIDKIEFTADMDSIECIRALKDGLNDLVGAVNLLLADRDKRVRGEASNLLVNMAGNPDTRLPLAMVHSTVDGEDILTHLIGAGMIVIVDGHVELTDAGRDQASMLVRVLES